MPRSGGNVKIAACIFDKGGHMSKIVNIILEMVTLTFLVACNPGYSPSDFTLNDANDPAFGGLGNQKISYLHNVLEDF
jgi:hypothetical protein